MSAVPAPEADARASSPVAIPIRERPEPADEQAAALAAHHLAWQERASAQDWRGVALSMTDTAQCHLRAGHHATALSLFDMAAKTLLRDLPSKGLVPDPYSAAMALVGASYALTGLGRAAAALARTGQADALLDPGSHHRIPVAEAAAAACQGAGDVEGALRYYGRALSVLGPGNLDGRERITAIISDLSMTASGERC